MTRGILVVGNESSLFSATAAEAVKRVESFASALIPNRLPQQKGAFDAVRLGAGLPEGRNVPPPTEAAGGAIPLSWSPASPISARTLVLAAENRLGQINDAIVVCSPPAVFKTVGNLMPEEIEIIVNDNIRGWFFLVRELVLYFRRFGSGALSLVVPEISPGGKDASIMNTLGKNSRNTTNATADLLGPSASASFRAFAQGVLDSQAGEPFKAVGFTTAEAGSEGDFAAWFFKIIDEGSDKNSGRWHKYSKLKFFR